MDGPALSLAESFAAKFGAAGELRFFRAPGRVNLIGEHTDYNLGYVMPIAIHLACYAAVAPSNDGQLRVYSRNLDELVSWPVESVASLQPANHWTDYIVGVAQQLQRLGFQLLPLNIALDSEVPVGSGLSSSASLEVSAALALLHGRTIEKLELAKLAQRAEREFVGVPCGIMDQYISVFGEAANALKLDCRALTHELAAIPPEASIVAVNSMVKHQLGESAYAARVRECGEAVSAIQMSYPDIQSLRDVPSSIVDRMQAALPDTTFRRARHVTTENERVVKFAKAADEADLHAMGRLFLASHRSLQRDYEVSCDELDFLVATASDFTGVYGARMTGGGFGGCTVNLVQPARLEAFEEHISRAYQREFSIEPRFYHCIPERGASPSDHRRGDADRPTRFITPYIES
ncbi:MAG: galactokinase [Bryobacteraceae bacterium]